MIFVSLGMAAAGLLSFLKHVCVVWFLASVVALLLDGQSDWREGVPDKILKVSERWPHKERRTGRDRREGGPPPA